MRRRILSIQGGGVNGIFAARILALIEEDLRESGLPPNAGNYFDLIAGTSTGGLIALGLALNISAASIVEIYRDKSSLIFPAWRRSALWKLSRRPVRRPIYDPAPLVAELKAVFGDRLLGHSATRVIIPAFNQSADSVHLFKTSHHRSLVRDYKLLAWDVAAATAAAPFYFPPHRMVNGTSYLDGGVWANSPLLIAVAECIQYCGWDRNNIDVLSIGGIRDVVSPTNWQGLVSIPGAIIGAQVKGSVASAKTLIGDVNDSSVPHGRMLELSSNVPTGTFAMDDAGSVQDLTGRAETTYRSRHRVIKDMFFAKAAEIFRPERNPSS